MTWILRKSCIASILCALFLCSSWADEAPKKQEADDAEEEQQDELVVSADRMEMQLDGRTVELTGNVRVEDSNMSLTALKMMVYLTESEKDNEKDGEKKEEKNGDDVSHSNMKLQRIEADGEVVLRKLDGTESAMGDHAVYDVKDDTILMTGNCSIIQGKNTMMGDKVVYDRKKAKINIQKPRLTIQIDKKGGKNNGALGNFFTDKDDKDDKKDKDVKDVKQETDVKDEKGVKEEKKEADVKDDKVMKEDNAPKDTKATKDNKTDKEKPKEDKAVENKPKEDKAVEDKPKEDKAAETKPKEDKKAKKSFWTWD
ncbi:MAG: hypothetical protein IKX30_11040 [Victivallales bacterium]|nr:hypothetical protein [Victivallales bacterium]